MWIQLNKHARYPRACVCYACLLAQQTRAPLCDIKVNRTLLYCPYILTSDASTCAHYKLATCVTPLALALDSFVCLYVSVCVGSLVICYNIWKAVFFSFVESSVVCVCVRMRCIAPHNLFCPHTRSVGDDSTSQVVANPPLSLSRHTRQHPHADTRHTRTCALTMRTPH